MPAREHLVRAIWTLFEPIHAVAYFAPEARAAFAAIGLPRYWDGYFAGRAAPLGPVSAAPIIAIFNGFSPFLVERALPSVWSVASVDQVLDARSAGAADALRTVVPDEATIAKAAAALSAVAERVDTAGRPLAAANRALEEQADPYQQLWRAATILREHRGDGHVIALVSEGIAGLASTVLRGAVDIGKATAKRTRGWSDEQWDAEVAELVGRGLLGADGTITSAGAGALNNAERLTNRLALRPWSDLGPGEFADVARLLEPIAHACGAVFPNPNPIGMPEPWRPGRDPEASAVPDAPIARVP